MKRLTCVCNGLTALLCCIVTGPVYAQEDVLIVDGEISAGVATPEERPANEEIPAERPTDEPPGNVLPPADWERVQHAVERALAWLAAQQQPDGSFPTLEQGQPGVTSL